MTMRKRQFVSLAAVLAGMRPSMLADEYGHWERVMIALADWCRAQAKPYRGTDGQLKAGFQRDKWIAMCNGQSDGGMVTGVSIARSIGR
jgi:hypothetical protein